MTDYFEMVPRTAPSELGTYSVETDADGIVTVTPPHRGRSLRFELIFRTMEGRDGFRQSRRRRTDAVRHGASLSIVTPHDLLSVCGDTTEQGLVSRPTLQTMTMLLGLSGINIRTGFRLAWDAVISWHQQQR